MTTTWNIINALKARIVEHIDEYIENPDIRGTVSDSTVFFGYPDVDRSPKLSFWIHYTYGSQEQETWSSDNSTAEVQVYVVCKGQSRDVLIEQCFAYEAALEQLIGADRTLGGVADGTEIRSSNWYTEAEGSPNTTAFQVTLGITWQKDFS